MLNNKQIASKFDLLAKLMELHEENPFKIRSYANAYLSLRKLEGNLAEMPKDELSAIPGIGSAIADKITELLTTGEMKTLNKYLEITPASIQEMLSIKGLGPKKVNQIWKEMGITSVGELLYACNENRLINYKGFGNKLQEELKEKIAYFMDSRGKFLYAHIHKTAEECLSLCSEQLPEYTFALCGDIRRKMPETRGIEILTDAPEGLNHDIIRILNQEEDICTFHGFPVILYHTNTLEFNKVLFEKSCSTAFLEACDENALSAGNESEIFTKMGVHFIPSELRENASVLNIYQNAPPTLIEVPDIHGIVHNHSTYSDGLHTLEEMASYVHSSGFQYFVISDHSKSAGYAGGLTETQLVAQWEEIDRLNTSYQDGFKIFKSIESDILTDGSLDYSEDILSRFDLVIASIHSGMNMDEERATARLIKAIENPYTKILGHPTGRLLLARPGYPVDYKKIIDACHANHVALELNANPQRLDIDWTWIPYAMEKGVMISINPDAHSKESIHYIQYGVAAARKGGLTKEMCLNTKTAAEFLEWIRL